MSCMLQISDLGSVPYEEALEFQQQTHQKIFEGRNAGCGLVIGVLSGASSETELRNAGADMILENITDLNKENIFNSIDDQTFLL